MKRYDFSVQHIDKRSMTVQLVESNTGQLVSFYEAEAAVKQARVDALEAAKQAVDGEELTDPQDASDDAYNAAVYDCVQAIKSLKGKTP